MIKNKTVNILAIGAHHDDIDLGAGGTLAKLAKKGHQVFGLTLTDSETHYDIKNIHRTKEQAFKEAQKAAEIIGMKLLKVPEEFLAKNGELVYDVKYMRFLEKLMHQHKIDFLFCHWQYDMNTDHEAASKLSIVAGRHLNRILMYRSNWYQPDKAFNGIIYSDISKTIDIKKKALLAYESEVKNRGQDWINSFLDFNHSAGFSIGVEYAEIFEPVRYLI